MITGGSDMGLLSKVTGDLSRWEKLPGDASTRKYYRLAHGDLSYILMSAEPFASEGERYPFLEVRAHLAHSGVDVPNVIEVDPTGGFILLEDLGDQTLLKRLETVSDPDVERQHYERAIDALVQLQYAGAPTKARHPIAAFSQRFDYEKLMWEVKFAIEHFYLGILKRQMSPDDHAVLLDGFDKICKILARQPTVLTHRDYHSRNIMLPKGKSDRFVMIDFQDARMGPAQYDLASLLRDSYYQLPETQVRKLVDYYLARWKAVSGESLRRRSFLRIFDLMSVQRNFKAIGSFASFMNKRGDPGYLKYIGNTFENIRRNLLKFPEFSRLREVLFHYYYF